MQSQERRTSVRRAADRELRIDYERFRALAEECSSGGHEIRRKRRHVIRHTCQVAIEMMIGMAAGASDVWSVSAVKIKGKLLDLSLEGASLFTSQPLETGQELKLTIALRNGARISAASVVRWIKAVPEKGGFASGAQFRGLTDDAKRQLAKFLAELDQTVGL
ncbi:MAG: PilZ domain-containing protein [Candidatus Hydrogenedentes bacterium]|nr:PilZ domain-containing protein [Candidatus Hydrogenedentota bacterium]